ncbi:unnamed protein product, partial [Effrenium voratum]
MDATRLARSLQEGPQEAAIGRMSQRDQVVSNSGGLFSAQSGESRPPKPPEAEEDWFNPKPLSANPLRFVGEGEASGPREEKSPEGELGGPGRIGPLGVLGFVPAQSAGAPQMVRAGMMPRPRSSVAPALIGLLSDQRWAGGGGATMLGELLAEALDSAAAERFLRLAEERLGSWGRTMDEGSKVKSQNKLF